MEEPSFIAVAGGANIDIGGMSFRAVIPHDSNPGVVRMSLGGVGRNIAHNLSLLNVPVRLFTAIGTDLNASRITQSCEALTIHLHALRCKDASTSTYLYVADANGDMTCAISDMEICSRLTPGFFAKELSVINRAKALVIDTNLPEETIRYLTEHVTVPVFADTVSVTKAGRLKHVLSGLHTLKPNRLEAELLSGMKVVTETDARNAASHLLEQGVTQVFLSLGEDGVLAARAEGMELIPPLATSAVSLTGAGDAFMAGLAYAYYHDMDFTQAGRVAASAAAIAIDSMETINEAMSSDLLRRTLEEAEMLTTDPQVRSEWR